uniref:Uncharacterized protein n=1 Tax=Anguilla anguilla TaxID=7936 RepID=A0A0E9SQ91_ANGAN
MLDEITMHFGGADSGDKDFNCRGDSDTALTSTKNDVIKTRR